jgi:hypothetical protein
VITSGSMPVYTSLTRRGRKWPTLF